MTQINVRLVPGNYGLAGSEVARWFADSGQDPALVVANQDAVLDLEKGELTADVFVLDKDGNRQPDGEAADGTVLFKKKSAKLKMVPIGAYGVL